MVQGLDSVPTDDQPTVAEVNTVHLAWDLMVGMGTLLFLLSAWYGLSWLFRRDMPKSRWFLRIAAAAGIASVVSMEAGWVVSEVGRQPWIVYNVMRVEDAATANTGVWIMSVLVGALYIGLGITTILILRKMSRRFRDRTARPTKTSHTVPADQHRIRVKSPSRSGVMSTAIAVMLFFGVTAYALFGGADFGAGFWDLIAGGAERGERPREVIDHSIGPVWEANHVWLIFVSSCCGPGSHRRMRRSP